MFLLLALNYNLFFLPFIGLSSWLHVISVPGLLFMDNMYLLLFAIPVVALFAYKKHKARFISRGKAFSEDNELMKLDIKKAIVYIKTFGYYVTHILFPIPKMYHKNLYYFGRYKEGKDRGYRIDSEFWKGLIIFLFFSYEMAMGNYWAFWFVLFISQWCGILTVTMNAADRYCSLPMVGLLMVCLKYLNFVPIQYRLIIISVFVTMWIIKYIRMTRAYTNLHQFYEYHLEINPADIEARVYYSEKLIQSEPFKALTLINDGLKYTPYDFKLLISMVLLQATLGRHDQVETFMKRAEQVIPLGEEEDTKIEFARMRKDMFEQSLTRKQKRKMKL